jgi:polyhydroxybutyrate depolymerase
MSAAPATVPSPRRRYRGRSLLVGTVAALVALTAACSGSSSASDRAPRSTTTTPDGIVSHLQGITPADAPTRAPTPAEAALVAARPYTLHVPAQPKDPAPLVVLLHGYGVTGAVQESYLKLVPVTDAHGMLFVTADGTPNALGKRFWNATDACCAGRRTDVDDSAYLRAVIADVAARHPVDPRRVYLVGHSNGGFMSYRMACDHADVIAAIVSFEAATYNDPSRCRPTTSVAVLEIHGTGDRVIAFDGGAITGVRYPGAQQTVETWARYDGCSLTPDDPEPVAHAIEADRPPATVTAYSYGCRGNGHTELWTQPDGFHIPALAPMFAAQVVDFLLAHPKQ